MSDTDTLERPAVAQGVAHFDVLIAGAGISGVGAAYHLQQQCPGKTFALIEAQAGFGGTWRTHKYPGIRSDSDLYTFGYRFKPWEGPPIAAASEILTYMGDVIADNDLERHIRYNHVIKRASWSSADNLWTVEAERGDTGESVRFTCNFLWMCQGYYNHKKPYTPEWPGMADFAGTVVHPQTWPDDIDLSGKRVVVIGSGATAATVVPAIAEQCAHVTMLQRSPTYFLPTSNVNELADRLRQIGVDAMTVHEVVRRQINFDFNDLIRRCTEEPESVVAELKEAAFTWLPEGYDFEKHFVGRYRPWQQRMAFIPDGDLYASVASGKASVVTDEIERITPTGILLKSGEELPADVIVTATGFDLSVMGDVQFNVDDKPVNFADTVTWRGMMFTGIPNMTWVFGYFRASWTLRVDLQADFMCRLFNHMDEKHLARVEPKLRGHEEGMERLPWIGQDNFNPGYLNRSMHLMPKRIEGGLWEHPQHYWAEKEEIPAIDLDGDALVYS
jgi:cation diffusion facilitator CzcD-associated flavoprotein CzcO